MGPKKSLNFLVILLDIVFTSEPWQVCEYKG